MAAPRFLQVLVFAFSLSLASGFATARDARFPDQIRVADLEQYRKWMDLSPAQWHALGSAYLDYLGKWNAIKPEIDTQRATSANANPATNSEFLKQVKEVRRDGDALRAKIAALDAAFFDAIAAVLADSQQESLARCRAHRTRQSNAIELLARSYEPRRIDVSDLAHRTLAFEQLALVEATLMEYERTLTPLTARFRESSHAWFPKLLQLLIDEGVEDASDPNHRYAEIGRLHWQKESAEFIAVADRIDSLNVATYERVRTAIAEEHRDAWRLAWWKQRSLGAAQRIGFRDDVRRVTRSLAGAFPERRQEVEAILHEYDRTFETRFAEMTAAEEKGWRRGPYDVEHLDRQREGASPFDVMGEHMQAARFRLMDDVKARLGEEPFALFESRWADRHAHYGDEGLAAFRGERLPLPRSLMDARFPESNWASLISTLAFDADAATRAEKLRQEYLSSMQVKSASLPALDDVAKIMPPEWFDFVRESDSILLDGLASIAAEPAHATIVEAARAARARTLLFCDRPGGAARCDLGEVLIASGIAHSEWARLSEVLREYDRKAKPLRNAWAEYSIQRLALDDDDWQTWEHTATLRGDGAMSAVAALNVETLPLILAVLSPESAANVRDRFERQGYSEVFRDDRLPRQAFEACGLLDDLAPEQIDSMLNLRPEFEAAYSGFSRRMIEAVATNTRWYRDETGGWISFEFAGRDEFIHRRFDRDELNELTRLRLGSILTEAQFERIATHLMPR